MSLNSLFAGSHYATKVYDKQLDFCEHYWGLTLEILKKLRRENATQSDVDDANRLYTYRMEKAIWLTEDMNLSLEGFEQALRSQGAASFKLEHMPVGEERSRLVNLETERFLGIIQAGKSDFSYSVVLEKLQEVLGISEAYNFRRKLMGKTENGSRLEG